MMVMVMMVVMMRVRMTVTGFVARVMMGIVFEQERADQIHRQANDRHPDGLVELDGQRVQHAMERLPGHQQGDHGEDDGAGEASQYSDFSGAEAVARVGGVAAAEGVSQGGDDKGGHVRAHVPAIGQERHGVENGAGRDFHHHHGSRDGDDDSRAPFGGGGVDREVVGVSPGGGRNRLHSDLMDERWGACNRWTLDGGGGALAGVRG